MEKIIEAIRQSRILIAEVMLFMALDLMPKGSTEGWALTHALLDYHEHTRNYHDLTYHPSDTVTKRYKGQGGVNTWYPYIY